MPLPHNTAQSTSQIFCGDALHVLKTLKRESVDLLSTDPPFGIGFMSKSWDKRLPQKEVFEGCFRTLKPGGFAFVMCAPRSDVCARMMLMLEEVGFDIGFTPIYWTYASGFPKAMNIGKTVDKRLGRKRNVVGRNVNSREKATTENSLYRPGTVGKTAHVTRGDHPLEGSYGGFQPKPAVEVIVVAMKPLSEKTFVGQALRNGKGVTWLDDCRIGTEQRTTSFMSAKSRDAFNRDDNWQPTDGHTISRGRFPANLLVSDDVLGDHSRFFALPFLIVPKASKREKNEGLSHLPVRQSTGRGRALQCSRVDQGAGAQSSPDGQTPQAHVLSHYARFPAGRHGARSFSWLRYYGDGGQVARTKSDRYLTGPRILRHRQGQSRGDLSAVYSA